VETTTEKVAIMRPMMVEKDRNSTWGVVRSEGGVAQVECVRKGYQGRRVTSAGVEMMQRRCLDTRVLAQAAVYWRCPNQPRAASRMAAAEQGDRYCAARQGQRAATSSCSRCWPAAAAAYLVCEQALELVVPHKHAQGLDQ
jgi:hypothetical protein